IHLLVDDAADLQMKTVGAEVDRGKRFVMHKSRVAMAMPDLSTGAARSAIVRSADADGSDRSLKRRCTVVQTFLTGRGTAGKALCSAYHRVVTCLQDKARNLAGRWLRT